MKAFLTAIILTLLLSFAGFGFSMLIDRSTDNVMSSPSTRL